MKPIDFDKLSILASDPKEFATACLAKLVEQCNENGHRMGAIADDPMNRVLPMLWMQFSFCTHCEFSVDAEVQKNGQEAFLAIAGSIEECKLGQNKSNIERIKIL